MYIYILCNAAVRTRQTWFRSFLSLSVFQRRRVVGVFFCGRSTRRVKWKSFRHVNCFLRDLVILKWHRADYYICPQFQVLLKHSVVPLAHVYAGLDLLDKKEKRGRVLCLPRLLTLQATFFQLFLFWVPRINLENWRSINTVVWLIDLSTLRETLVETNKSWNEESQFLSILNDFKTLKSSSLWNGVWDNVKEIAG